MTRVKGEMAATMDYRSVLQSARTRAGQPLRFVIAGAINTVLGFVFYPALLWLFPYLHVHYLIALGISQAVCTSFAYASYKFTVFQTRGGFLREFVRFCSFYGVVYAFNWIALPFLVRVCRLDPVLAQTGLALALTIGSYFWHRRVTFKAA